MMTSLFLKSPCVKEHEDDILIQISISVDAKIIEKKQNTIMNILDAEVSKILKKNIKKIEKILLKEK